MKAYSRVFVFLSLPRKASDSTSKSGPPTSPLLRIGAPMSLGKTDKSFKRSLRLAFIIALVAVSAYPSAAQVLGPVYPEVVDNKFSGSGLDSMNGLDTVSYTSFNSNVDSQLLGRDTFTELDRWSYGPFFWDYWPGFYDPDHDKDHDPTPEPASFFLMGTGMLAIGVLLRRRLVRT